MLTIRLQWSGSNRLLRVKPTSVDIESFLFDGSSQINVERQLLQYFLNGVSEGFVCDVQLDKYINPGRFDMLNEIAPLGESSQAKDQLLNDRLIGLDAQHHQQKVSDIWT